MNPELFVNRDETRAPKIPVHLRDVFRLVRVVGPERKTLLIGLAFSLVFAAFHTVSVSGAFPVFKILLEPEGLRAWADRVVAAERIGADLSPVDDRGLVRVLKIRPGGSAAAAGIRTGDEFPTDTEPASDGILHALASAETGAEIGLPVLRDSQRQSLVLRPAEAELPFRWLHRVAMLVPADTPEQKLRALATILIALVFVAVVANLCRYYGEVLVASAVLRSLMQLRAVLYQRVLALPMSYFAGQPTADIVTRFVQDMQELQRGLITLFGKFIREPLRVAFLLSWALLVDWRITLLAMLVTPIVVAVFWAVGRKVKKANKKLLEAYGLMIGTLSSTLENLRVVKAYTAEEYEQQRLDRVDRHMFRQQLKLARLDAFTGPMLEILAITAGSLVTVWLLSRVLNHELSLSRFVTLGVALSVLFDPLRKLSDVWVRIQRSLAAGERIFHVLDEPVESPRGAEAIELPLLKKSIDFEKVTFTYPGAERPALREIDLTIRAGETVALVGPNGSGKTTLTALLLRFFDPDSGVIRYDGLDLRGAGLKSLRCRISLVTQDSVVFAGTPVENIAYGGVERVVAQHEPGTRPASPSATHIAAGSPVSPVPFETNGRVRDAAARAFADEFIRQLPRGYETILGERGNTLSGGQRQRLAIARAIYRDAPILIFDEATSQIDSESELKIQTALRDLAKDRTTIIIAHRLSTIQFAHRIVVMDAGRILDQGTHAELLARCRLYRALCETQLLAEPSM